MVEIHVNCDVGEEDEHPNVYSFEEIAPFMSSANIACGYHAGNANLIAKSIQTCLKHRVEIGAHPSYPDRENFGRIRMNINEETLYNHILFQLGTISAIARNQGTQISHVKLHGALYNETAINEKLCKVVFEAIKKEVPKCEVYGMFNTYHQKVANHLKINFKSEGFGDRRYKRQGQLLDRKLKGAVITDEGLVVEQVDHFLKNRVKTIDSGFETINVNTICVHGDNSNIVKILKRLSESFLIMKECDV
jgi:UPF0271 protein